MIPENSKLSKQILSLAAAVAMLGSSSLSQAGDLGISYTKKEGGAPGLVAKFEGKEITLDQLEKTSPEIYSARLEVYKAQKAALDEIGRAHV